MSIYIPLIASTVCVHKEGVLRVFQDRKWNVMESCILIVGKKGGVLFKIFTKRPVVCENVRLMVRHTLKFQKMWPPINLHISDVVINSQYKTHKGKNLHLYYRVWPSFRQKKSMVAFSMNLDGCKSATLCQSAHDFKQVPLKETFATKLNFQ